MKDVNYDDDTLVLGSIGEVLQVNERGNCFYNTLLILQIFDPDFYYLISSIQVGIFSY